MEFQKFLTQLDRIVVDYGRGVLKNRVAIVVHRPGSIGGSPVVDVKDVEIIEVKDASKGIDWNTKLIMLTLEKPVSTLSVEQRDAITENIRRGQSMEAYEQYKSLHARIDQLKALLDRTAPAYKALLGADRERKGDLDAFNAELEALAKPAR